MINLRLALVAELRPKLEPLLLRHRSGTPTARLAPVPSPDWVFYGHVEAAGRLILIAAEDGAELIGYCSCVLSKAHHDVGMLIANNDAIYIIPERRGAGLAARMISLCETEAANRGAVVSNMTVYETNNFGPLLMRGGYAKLATIFQKPLRETA